MIYSLVHFTHIDAERISQIRGKYDPQVELIQPHITVMFPVPESIGEDKLFDHLGHILRNTKSFTIQLQGLAKSPDDYLLAYADIHRRVGPSQENGFTLCSACYTWRVSRQW